MNINIPLKYYMSMALIFAVANLSACGGGGGEEQSSLPIVLDAPIAYVKRPVLFDNNGNLVQTTINDPIAFHEGGDLYVRARSAPSAEEVNVTSFFTRGRGDVKDPEFSFDGTKIIFAMRAPDILNAQPEDQPKWDIWEYNLETNRAHRIISDPIIAQQHHDVSPHYLPDGQIIFSSSRQQTNRSILTDEGKEAYSGQVERGSNQIAMVIHRMSSTGTNITQLSFNQSHDFDPMVLQSGRVLFSRWDNAGGQNAINLYSVNPDGTELHLTYGAHSHNTGSNNSNIQFMKTIESSTDGEVISLLMPFTGTLGGGMVSSIDITNFIDNTTPTQVNQGISGTAQTALVNTNIITDGSPSPGGLYASVYPLRDNTGRALVSWTPCRLQDINNNIIPCSADNLANPANVTAPPLFGLFIFDAINNTQVPIEKPVEGIMFSDVIASTPRTAPTYIADKSAGDGLVQSYIDENVGVLNIRSVYDMDAVDTAPGGIDAVSDPEQVAVDLRPARFIRIVKAVSIPDDTTSLAGDLDNSAYGVSTAQRMREIIGYAPIQPDGSVKVKVPANTPLAISILDKDGKRTSSRHQNWIQVGKGETLTCNGCHNHASGNPHGRPDGPPSINGGAPFDGYVFPNAEPVLFANTGETMADVRTRQDPTTLTPTVDIVFTDVWTIEDPMGANLTKAAPLSYLYADLTTPSAPASADCQTNWQNLIFPYCRTVINYETHIHPLWSTARTNALAADATCINCHTNTLPMAPPDGQLDLTDGLSDLGQQNHFKSYRELLSGDNEQFFDGAGLSDVVTLVDVTDPVTGITTQVPQFTRVNPTMSTQGAAASGNFFTRFETGSGDVTHEGALTPAELKLIAEWLDIGGQYYNNPFDADPARFVN